MKRICYGLAALLVAAILLPTSLLADGLPSRSRVGAPEVSPSYDWTGGYVSGGLGYGLAHTEVNIDTQYPINIDGLSADGYVGDVRVGFNWQIPNTPFVVGPFVGYNFGDMKFAASADDATLSAKLTPEWYAGALVGAVIGQKAMVYGGAAWQRAKGSLGGNIVDGSQSDDAVVYLAGLEYAMTPNLRLGMEYNYAEYSFSAGEIVDINPEVHTIKARLTLAINPF